jgi:type I restriction-modification system DNA methylase subunit
VEQLGSKPKFWFNEEGKRLLFKGDARGTGEDWAEVIACCLCAELGLPHVQYELAIAYGGGTPDQRGVVCESMARPPVSLDLGNQLLLAIDNTYPTAKRYKVSQHTVQSVNFLQHVRGMLKMNGRCAIVVPDNVLFEGGAGETVRRNLLRQCDVHTLLRLPTGLFYAQGVKANVLFFDAKPAQEKPWTSKLWVYDLRTNKHFTLKTNPLKRADLDEFVGCYQPGAPHKRKPTWSEKNPEGRWRCFDYEELIKRDKVNLDIFWLKDKSLEESESLPEPQVIAEEIVEDLESALEQFSSIAEKLGKDEGRGSR